MKVLIFSTSSNNTETFIGSLDSLNSHEIRLFRYDQKWHQTAIAAIQQNKEVENLIRTGQWQIPRERVSADADMLSEARKFSPDLMIYISAWEGLFVPKDETLGELNSIAPLVHFLCDGADPPWWPQLDRFEKNGIFTLTVNIDGSHRWPGGEFGLIKNALTLLTPIDPRPFSGAPYPPSFLERPYAVGYAGNPGNHPRRAIIDAMTKAGFAIRYRDDQPGSYRDYVHFLRHCRAVVSVPFTGSGAARHVKGRVIEAGYAGCALLEWKNDATAAWFTPRLDYEEFETVEEAIDLAHFIAKTPRRTEDLAEALSDRVLCDHTPAVFWKKVIERAGK